VRSLGSGMIRWRAAGLWDAFGCGPGSEYSCSQLEYGSCLAALIQLADVSERHPSSKDPGSGSRAPRTARSFLAPWTALRISSARPAPPLFFRVAASAPGARRRRSVARAVLRRFPFCGALARARGGDVALARGLGGLSEKKRGGGPGRSVLIVCICPDCRVLIRAALLRLRYSTGCRRRASRPEALQVEVRIRASGPDVLSVSVRIVVS